MGGQTTCDRDVDKQQAAILDDVTSHNVSGTARHSHHGGLHEGTHTCDQQHSPVSRAKHTTETHGGDTQHGDSVFPEQKKRDHTHEPDSEAERDRPTTPQINFDRIRKVCEKDLYEKANIDLRPVVFADHRRNTWPHIVPGTLPTHMVKIYDVVRQTGVPNAMAARVRLPAALDLDAWRTALDTIGGNEQLMDFLTFGFPIDYVGPMSDSGDVENHPSATEYPVQVEAFIDKEISLKGVLGPFRKPPFAPWCHISPLMSRPKADPGARRVITDMTFPSEKSINAYVIKNGIYGIEMEHRLPTVDRLVQDLRPMPKGVFLATIDISRAYKNFNSDPLDWPLLCFSWKDRAYCDVTVPFGSRASSYHMQSVAEAIVMMLAVKGIKAYMYLDDLIILSHTRGKAQADYIAARQLLAELTLPEAVEKAQPPAQRVKWLGVIIDTLEMSVSIPEDKLAQVLHQVSDITKARSITKKQLQSVLGLLLHVAKCVHPARLFVSRLLEALRAAHHNTIKVSEEMKADFRWFTEFCGQWNGKSYIPAVQPAREIYVDACLSGIGATDGVRAYGGQVAPIHDGAANITELEALNVVVAVHSLVDNKDKRSHIRVHCDNMAAVQVFQSGAGRNPLLLDCARALWMVQALLDIQISYVHVPGARNVVADALSRQHLNNGFRETVGNIVINQNLTIITPCLYVFGLIPSPLLSRSGHRIIAQKGGQQTAAGQSARDHGQPGVNRGYIHRFRQEGPVPPPQTDTPDALRVHRVPGRSHPSTRDHQEQDIPYTDIHQTLRRGHQGGHPPAHWAGVGRPYAPEGVQTEQETPHTNGHTKVGSSCYTKHTTRCGSEGCNTAYVLCRPEAAGGGTPGRQKVRPSAPPNTGRFETGQPGIHPNNKMGKEHAEDRTGQGGQVQTGQGQKDVPSGHSGKTHPSNTNWFGKRPPHHVQKDKGPCPSLGDRLSMAHSARSSWGRHKAIFAPQPQEGRGHTGPPCWLWRPTGPETRRLEIQCI